MYAISSYILQYKIFGDDHWMTYDTVKGDNHRIDGLNPGTGYQIRTKAQNQYGHSEPSKSLEITTLDKGKIPKVFIDVLQLLYLSLWDDAYEIRHVHGAEESQYTQCLRLTFSHLTHEPSNVRNFRFVR